MTHEPPRTSQPQLVRAIGRWSMVALAVNSILGSGIFGLPSVITRLVGSASPAAVLIAGAGMAVIIACYAEVASQFTGTGGTYLYVRHAFGRFAGLQVGWLMLLSRLTACAAGVNLLVVYLGEFWPEATQPLPRLAVITVFLATLAAVNYRGVGAGTLLSNTTVLANMLAGPGGAFALAERRDFPAWFAAIHHRFRTPHRSIALFALLLWGFSQFASFSWNVTLSAVARLFFYAAVCVAVPVLRRAQPAAAAFRLPGGLILPVVGVMICAVLLTRVDFSKSLILLATIGA